MNAKEKDEVVRKKRGDDKKKEAAGEERQDVDVRELFEWQSAGSLPEFSLLQGGALVECRIFGSRRSGDMCAGCCV